MKPSVMLRNQASC